MQGGQPWTLSLVSFCTFQVGLALPLVCVHSQVVWLLIPLSLVQVHGGTTPVATLSEPEATLPSA